MKRLIIILSVLLVNVLAYANANFDKTLNYQFNNSQAYVGEILYLMPRTGSVLTTAFGDQYEHYHNFMDFYQFNDDAGGGKIFDQYKYDINDIRDNKACGTHKRHIEGHKFRVDKVASIKYYDWKWVLYLTDLNTGDKLKFIYDGSERDQIDYDVFPFIVEKYYKYLKSLIGTKLVFATTTPNIYLTEGSYFNKHFPTYEEDIKTGEKINYTEPYVKWTIKDVGIDDFYASPYFIVSNGKYTTKVIYNNPYYEKNEYMAHTYCVINRVFTEKQWNILVNKYGEEHMTMIMKTQASDDMTKIEKYMAGGGQYGKFEKYKNTSVTSEFSELAKETGKAISKSAKDTYNSTKTFIKEVIKMWQK